MRRIDGRAGGGGTGEPSGHTLPLVRGLAAAVLAMLLSACGSEGDGAAPQATNVPGAVARAPVGQPVGDAGIGTPVKDRVATLGLLNKRNNLVQDIVLKPGEARRAGNVVVRLATCERTAPWERPEETGAFVQVFVEERASAREKLAWRTVFSGWLFRNSPSVNVVEHPVYDVWIKDCAMKFPGEEESPAAFASPTSAAKASGSGSPAPAASPSPNTSPAPSPTPDIGRAEDNPPAR